MLRKSSYLQFICILAVLIPACTDDSTTGGKAELVCESGFTVCGHICCDKTCCDGQCIDTAADISNCGECGNACEADQTCRNSSCTDAADACTGDEQLCDGKCVDVASNSAHCGKCGNTCLDNETCHDGTCTLICDSPRRLCDGSCIDVTRDAFNCGECGNICGTNMHCADSRCVCRPGTSNCDGDDSNGCEINAPSCPVVNVPDCTEDQTVCGEVCCAASAVCCDDSICVDTASDPLHCGSCTIKCEPAQACIDGICTESEITCESDTQINCHGVCIDPADNFYNCGECGNACAHNQICEAGACVDLPELNCTEIVQKACRGECRDIMFDRHNCGECDRVCSDGELCSEGKCIPDPALQCLPTESYCFGQCIDTTNNRNHCGACGTKCESGYICTDGLCTIDCGGKTRCSDTLCTDINTDPENCGACGQTCKINEICDAGQCACTPGKYDCDGNAENGCESSAACSCTPGETRACWRGAPETRNVGICKDGQQVCDASGQFWGPCTGGTYPTQITCDVYGTLNGLDNDCDGKIDDVCRSSCDIEAGALSYIGCEYWTVYMDNAEPTNHTIVISNPSKTQVTKVYIFDKQHAMQSQNPLHEITVQPNEVKFKIINTYTTNMSRGSGIRQNAYRIRAEHPVVVYQFNPWDRADAHSNDASLLLPAPALGNEYLGLTWSTPRQSSEIAIIATQPGTTNVNVKTMAPVSAGNKVSNMNPGDTSLFELEQYDVLTLVSETGNPTGTNISSDKNIAVFGGSKCTNVPNTDYGYCDHIEEQLFPLHAWGKEYLCAKAYSKANAGNFWRIMAQKDNTNITITPDIGKNKTINAGEFIEFETPASFKVYANNPISVGQFLPARTYNSSWGYGDPSFILAVPNEQYRDNYAFMVPPSYVHNYITIIMPSGINIYLDGKKLSQNDYVDHKLIKIDQTDYVVGYISINEGAHFMNADKPFGLSNYGYFQDTSYGYPIGLDLKPIAGN